MRTSAIFVFCFLSIVGHMRNVCEQIAARIAFIQVIFRFYYPEVCVCRTNCSKNDQVGMKRGTT